MSTLTDNAALNQIVTDLAQVKIIVAEQYTNIVSDGFAALTGSDVASRVATPKAVATIIVNKGPASVLVKEGTIPVLIVGPMEAKELPVPGVGQIDVTILPGSTTTANVAISTYVNSNLV